jgi:hypothetical protein
MKIRRSRFRLRGLTELGRACRQHCCLPLEEYLHCWQQSCADLGAPGRLPTRIRDLLFFDEPAPTFYNRPAQANLQWPNRGDVRQEVVALDDLVSQDHPVRTVWEFAAKLDLGSLIGAPGGSSRPAPALLTALWLWATVEGIGSARHLARLCEQQHAYRWLCGGVAVMEGHARWRHAKARPGSNFAGGSRNGGGNAKPLILCTGNGCWNGTASATPLIPSIGSR